MDQLLLKAWNKKEKRMYPVICINLNNHEIVVDTIAIGKDYKDKVPTLTYRYPEEVSVLQYIGTEDKNKKNIFEGDIVRWKVFEEYYSLEAFIKNDYITGIVEWSEEECCFRVMQITEGMNIYKCEGFVSENYTRFYNEEDEQVFDWNSVGIIGNKFDNPDLAIDKFNKKEE